MKAVRQLDLFVIKTEIIFTSKLREGMGSEDGTKAVMAWIIALMVIISAVK